MNLQYSHKRRNYALVNLLHLLHFPLFINKETLVVGDAARDTPNVNVFRQKAYAWVGWSSIVDER